MDQSKRHIAVLPFPFASHSLSIFTLARMISKSAPDVNISYISTSRSIASVFKGSDAVGIDNIKPFTIRDGLPEGYKPSRNPTEPIALFLNVARDSFREGIQKAESERGVKISCLLSDAFVYFAADIAEDLKVPWVAFWGAAPISIAIHYHTDNILEKLACNESGGKEVTTLDFIPGPSGITKDDLPTEVVTYGKSDDVMSSLLYEMGKQLKRAAAIVINSFEEMDQEITNYLISTFSLYLNVGPFTLLTSSNSSVSASSDDTSGCLTWLSSQEPSSVAYVSFGSVIVPPPHEIVAIAEALEESKVPFLWSFRGDPSQLLPQGFSERTVNRGKITAWAPQVDVLSHASVGAFVTHGGWNSVVETITGGVPMICRPFFGDQKLNRKLMQDIWGIGTGVEGDGITKDGMVNALRKVLLEEEGKRMREKITCLKKLSVEACEAQGSSMKCFKQLVDLLI
ncbi:unnamed protein product [Rhodiola kirilowii]